MSKVNSSNIRQLLEMTRIKADEIRNLITKKQNPEHVKPETESSLDQLKELLRSLETKIEYLKTQSATDFVITRSDLYQEY